MRVAYQTRIGTKRDVNQDTLYVDNETGLFIVADGMGGHNAGEIASHVAVKEISDSIREGVESGADIKEILEQAVVKAHEAIVQNSLIHGDHRDMGTTVVLALVRDHRAWVCHVGDSRAYLIGERLIQQMTKDHSFLADMVEEGQVTLEQARTHPARHALTMALGPDDTVEPEIREIKLREDQCILLCSDGLTDVLEDSAMLAIIQTSTDPDAACRDLVNEARKRGGVDDVSTILLCP